MRNYSAEAGGIGGWRDEKEIRRRLEECGQIKEEGGGEVKMYICENGERGRRMKKKVK